MYAVGWSHNRPILYLTSTFGQHNHLVSRHGLLADPREGAIAGDGPGGVATAPMAAYALVDLHNRDHLAVVYGEDFAAAALRALQWRLHLWGGSVATVDHRRFLVALPPLADQAAAAREASALPDARIEAWQQALFAQPFASQGRRALLVVSVDRVQLPAHDYLDGRLPHLQEFEGQGMGVPALPSLPCGWVGRLAYEADMEAALAFHRALTQGRVQLALQPVVAAGASGRACGDDVLYQEALLRVAACAGEPDMSACELVPALERLGLVRLLDWVVLDAVVGQLEADPSLRLGCNLSAQSLVPGTGSWGGTFDRLRKARSVAARLTLEITETAPLPDFGQAVELVKAMRQMGCQIAIDDFGAGHTRLDFVCAVAPQVIKLCGGLVRAASGSRTAADYLQHLAALAGTLSPLVVAEGVGSQDEVLAASLAGVPWLQGRAVAPVTVGQPSIPLILPVGMEQP